MNLLFLLGIGFGMVAALMLNIGKGIQKQKVHIFVQGRGMFYPPYRKDLGIWLMGLTLTAGAAVPFSMGLKLSQSPSAISAMTGIGLIGLVIYAMKVIGEKPGVTDSVGIGMVVVGTSVLGWIGAEREVLNRAFTDLFLVKIILLMLLATIVVAVVVLYLKRLHGLVFGLSAGMMVGIALVLADAALVRADGSMVGQLGTPYPYAAMVFAMLATVFTQIGFVRARALEVVPSVNPAILLTPILLEIMIYGVWPEIGSLCVIGVIFAGVVLLSTGAAAKVSA